MAVSMSDISKLRKLTGAGMMDCKKALEETNCDMDAAVEIIRKKGQAVAAKREDREASEGCVLSASENGFAAIVALKCETDFVAKNEGFVALTKSILEAAMAAKAKSLDEVKASIEVMAESTTTELTTIASHIGNIDTNGDLIAAHSLNTANWVQVLGENTPYLNPTHLAVVAEGDITFDDNVVLCNITNNNITATVTAADDTEAQSIVLTPGWNPIKVKAVSGVEENTLVYGY